MHKKGNRKQPKKRKTFILKTSVYIYIRYNTLSNQNTKKEKEELFT